jgi:hypothetical protein|tara:strand:- start:448 stop:699 length:252 start_codon:yes stop_codon:yes gene_type:complete
MDIKEKQEFELAFNYIGQAMATAFEKADPQRKKQIGLFISCINKMYKYTNRIETELILKQTNNDTTFGRKKLLQKRIAEKNGR